MVQKTFRKTNILHIVRPIFFRKVQSCPRWLHNDGILVFDASAPSNWSWKKICPFHIFCLQVCFLFKAVLPRYFLLKFASSFTLWIHPGFHLLLVFRFRPGANSSWESHGWDAFPSFFAPIVCYHTNMQNEKQYQAYASCNVHIQYVTRYQLLFLICGQAL